MAYLIADAGNFDWIRLLYFLSGIGTGFLLFLLVLAIILSSKIKDKKIVSGPTIESLKEEDVKKLIEAKKKDFIYQIDEKDGPYLKTLWELSLELVKEIAAYYYPNSKNPMLELTVEEFCELSNYITNQVMKITEKKLAKIFKLKNKKVSELLKFASKSEKIANDETLNAGSEAAKIGSIALHSTNPIWFMTKTSTNIIGTLLAKKLCKWAISVVGIESNKIYSKSLFKKDVADTEKIEEIYNDELEEE